MSELSDLGTAVAGENPARNVSFGVSVSHQVVLACRCFRWSSLVRRTQCEPLLGSASVELRASCEAERI